MRFYLSRFYIRRLGFGDPAILEFRVLTGAWTRLRLWERHNVTEHTLRMWDIFGGHVDV